METKYSIAWKAYKESEDFKRSLCYLLDHGFQRPYADNILRHAFDAGFNAADIHDNKTVKQ